MEREPSQNFSGVPASEGSAWDTLVVNSENGLRRAEYLNSQQGQFEQDLENDFDAQIENLDAEIEKLKAESANLDAEGQAKNTEKITELKNQQEELLQSTVGDINEIRQDYGREQVVNALRGVLDQKIAAEASKTPNTANSAPETTPEMPVPVFDLRGYNSNVRDQLRSELESANERMNYDFRAAGTNEQREQILKQREELVQTAYEKANQSQIDLEIEQAGDDMNKINALIARYEAKNQELDNRNTFLKSTFAGVEPKAPEAESPETPGTPAPEAPAPETPEAPTEEESPAAEPVPITPEAKEITPLDPRLAEALKAHDGKFNHLLQFMRENTDVFGPETRDIQDEISIAVIFNYDNDSEFNPLVNSAWARLSKEQQDFLISGQKPEPQPERKFAPLTQEEIETLMNGGTLETGSETPAA